MQNEAKETCNTGTVVCGMSHVVTETVENNEFLKRFKNFNITSTEQDIDELVAIYNESTHVFHEEILERSKLFFEEQYLVSEYENITSDENEPMDVDTISQRLQAINILDNV